MEFKVTTEGNETVAYFKGRLDTPASQEIAASLEPLLEAASGTVILDCNEMEYISSSGLRIFLTVRKAGIEKGGKVIVRGISDSIRQVFMMTGFLNIFEIE